MIDISGYIEALLFGRAEPWEEQELAKTLSISTEDVREALQTLSEKLDGRGLVLVRAGNTVTLGTHPEISTLLEKIYKEDLEKGLSKASVETLSIILYGENVTRGVVDYIRGVNSSFIIRSLLVRGLIERKANPRDKKRFIYTPTIDLLASLGVADVLTLPDYEKIHSELITQSQGVRDETATADLEA